MTGLFLIVGISFFLFLAWAALISYKERELRAAKWFTAAAVFAIVLYGLPCFLLRPLADWLLYPLTVIPLLIALFFLVPLDFTSRKIKTSPPPDFRFDEREIMFSRRLLKPGTARYREYYRLHPGHETLDAVWRNKPGLLSSGAKFYDPVWFKAAQSSFETIEYLHPYVDGEVLSETVPLEPEKITKFLKDWLLRSGAHSVGVTELKDYHYYSHLGRQEPYGAPIAKEHRFALAFTVEMHKENVDFAPLAPTVLESADQYVRAGVLAVKTALMLRKLGYAARAHIDGNYRVICPLVARDAGLGEIGRMGLLMTPKLGPRVRIGVVTTNLPLLTDTYVPDKAMIDFCLQCSKCADNCPGKAIPYGERRWDHNVLRWKINAEACYTYWTISGTDCARCIQVCPFSHPDNGLHALVRRTVRVNSIGRTLAVKMDDVFYGRKPAVRNGFLSFVKTRERASGHSKVE